MSFDCRTCGACCHGGEWVPVESTDDVPESLTRPGDKFYPAFMRMRCCALNERAGRFTCGIYKHRPQACRDFEPGEPGCLAAREEMGLSVKNVPVRKPLAKPPRTE